MPKASYTCRRSERMPSRPLVVITGSAGDIGSTLARPLQSRYTVVGLDRASSHALRERLEVDLTSGSSVDRAMHTLRERHETHVAPVVHLATYFTGDEHPPYRAVNVDGAARLLQALQNLEVEHSFTRAPCWSTSPCSPESVSGRVLARAELGLSALEGRRVAGHPERPIPSLGPSASPCVHDQAQATRASKCSTG